MVMGTLSSLHSKLPYEVSPEQALSYPEVQRRLDISIRNLLMMTDKFVSAITSSVDKIPYVSQGLVGTSLHCCWLEGLGKGGWVMEGLPGPVVTGSILLAEGCCSHQPLLWAPPSPQGGGDGQ